MILSADARPFYLPPAGGASVGYWIALLLWLPITYWLVRERLTRRPARLRWFTGLFALYFLDMALFKVVRDQRGLGQIVGVMAMCGSLGCGIGIHRRTVAERAAMPKEPEKQPRS